MYLMIIYIGILKGKSRRGAKQLLQTDLSAFDKTGEAECLQQ